MLRPSLHGTQEGHHGLPLATMDQPGTCITFSVTPCGSPRRRTPSPNLAASQRREESSAPLPLLRGVGFCRAPASQSVKAAERRDGPKNTNATALADRAASAPPRGWKPSGSRRAGAPPQGTGQAKPSSQAAKRPSGQAARRLRRYGLADIAPERSCPRAAGVAAAGALPHLGNGSLPANHCRKPKAEDPRNCSSEEPLLLHPGTKLLDSTAKQPRKTKRLRHQDLSLCLHEPPQLQGNLTVDVSDSHFPLCKGKQLKRAEVAKGRGQEYFLTRTPSATEAATVRVTVTARVTGDLSPASTSGTAQSL